MKINVHGYIKGLKKQQQQKIKQKREISNQPERRKKRMKVRWEKGNENLGCHRTALIVFEHIQIRSGKYRGIRDRHWVWQASSNSPMAQVGHNRTNKVTSGAVTP